ncbi:gluconate 2-dehydrogenase subunit 3 family protein [Scleromatobacter humisilvae]|uniref:Gluconate 2-dehydrogenase subunit 3 family protein n=1 Tax=Scleromatobacter humisilvae TaxID=2897159 RepID=A0A9X1YLS1_9BURK|nr:gluconate 2-dehydrogenase subunit 3 family protein [Scleromatobacter humisilvae]MCK9687118.1 gluconate 2-dehydrogenase subunit 3 family protein [Scleromatobacter humisilvae]
MKSKVSIGRRMFLLRAAAPVAGVAVPGVLRPDAASAAEPRRDYTPSYFNAAEWAFVSAAVDRLIPADQSGPGGVATGVPEFIDRQMEMPYGHGAYAYMAGPFQTGLDPTLGYQLPHTPRDLYRKGIAASNEASRKMHGAPFDKLASARQDEFLGLLEGGRIAGDDPPLAAFFAQLLENTREGFFADPMYGGNRGMAGWKLIGFPGARADFTDWIDQAGQRYPFGPVSINGERA